MSYRTVFGDRVKLQCNKKIPRVDDFRTRRLSFAFAKSA